MKIFFAIIFSSIVIVLAGCGTVGTDFKASVRKKFDGPVYRIKVVSGDSHVVYEAARRVVDKLGFRFVSGGPSQGRIEALSGVSANDSLQGARQLAMKVRLNPVATGGTEVAVLFIEQVQDDFNRGMAQATETPLRESALYDVFFRTLEQSLDSK